jgi:hypothetical protein
VPATFEYALTSDSEQCCGNSKAARQSLGVKCMSAGASPRYPLARRLGTGVRGSRSGAGGFEPVAHRSDGMAADSGRCERTRRGRGRRRAMITIALLGVNRERRGTGARVALVLNRTPAGRLVDIAGSGRVGGLARPALAHRPSLNRLSGRRQRAFGPQSGSARLACLSPAAGAVRTRALFVSGRSLAGGRDSGAPVPQVG